MSTQAENPRIGLVIGQLSYGGAERHCVELARGLKEDSEFEPIVFCTSTRIALISDGKRSSFRILDQKAWQGGSGEPRTSSVWGRFVLERC